MTAEAEPHPADSPLPDPAGQDRRLIEGPIASTLVLFALPLLSTNIMHSVAATANAVWVSHILGPNALTAVVNSNVLLMMLMGIVMGLGMASNIIIGQAYGAGNIQELKRVAGTSAGFVLACAIVLGLGGIAFAPAILDLMRTPIEAREDAITFFKATCFAMPTIFVFILMMMMLRGCGDARTPFRYTLLWIVLGLILSPILLTGSFGFPKLGIAGAMIGSLIGNAVALMALLVELYRRKDPLALSGAELRYFIPDPRLLRLLVMRGLPIGVESVLVSGAYVIMLSMVNNYGAATAAAYGAASQLWAYVQLPAMAIAASVSSMASQNIGAGRWDRVAKLATASCVIGTVITGAIVLFLYALGDLPLRLFLPEGGAALEAAIPLNAITLWSWIPLAITFAMFGIVRANGAMIPPMIILAGMLWFGRIPFAQGLQPMLGVDAIWWSFPVGTIGSALLAYAYYRWGGWRNNALMVSAPSQDDPCTPASSR